MKKFLKTRKEFTPSKGIKIRAVFTSEIIKVSGTDTLVNYVADKTPLFYRNFSKLVSELEDGYFTTPMKETLEKLPDSHHYQSSHFGEICATIFVEEILGIKKVYSKLSLNTTENQNAYKMDLICFIPGTNPLEFVFCEVKSSNKHKSDGFPAKHDTSCYADIFNSLKKYETVDLDFDLTAIKDNLDQVPEVNREEIRKSLIPYGDKKVAYKGVAVIDLSTIHEDECNVLSTRKCNKDFDIEVVCIEDYKEVALEVYQKLETLKTFLKHV